MSWPPQRRQRISTYYGRTSCRGGCSEGRPRGHHSREEAQYCDTLDLRVKARDIRSYRTQVRYDLKDRHGKPCGYLLVDFECVYPDNKIHVIEYKGSGFLNSPEFRHKKALFSWNYPDVPYHVATAKDIFL